MFEDSATVISFLRQLRIETCRKEHGCGVNRAAASKKPLELSLPLLGFALAYDKVK